jgi:hypothetical protein
MSSSVRPVANCGDPEEPTSLTAWPELPGCPQAIGGASEQYRSSAMQAEPAIGGKGDKEGDVDARAPQLTYEPFGQGGAWINGRAISSAGPGGTLEVVTTMRPVQMGRNRVDHRQFDGRS